MLYFKNKAEKLIQLSDKNKIVIPDEMLFPAMESPSYEDFIRTIKTKKLKFEINSQKIVLSRREYDCLTHVAKGKAIKEVANILNISPRTVEAHLYNAKNKTNCRSKSNLVDLFWSRLHHLYNCDI